ncbi:MAG: exopolysaccharide biosynthesis protein [Pseudomonadota bacterium]
MADGFAIEKPEQEEVVRPLGAVDFLQSVLVDLAGDAAVRAEAPGQRLDGDEQTDAPTEATASLGAVVDRLDERAFGLMLLLLALPCCLPFVYLLPQIVALPMAAIAAQMALGREQPWLPSALGARTFRVDHFQAVVSKSARYVRWVEAIARPSLLPITGKTGVRLVGTLLMAPCVSILVPLPATNTVPGVGVAIAALGLIERDGRLVALGLVIGFVWIGALLIFGLEAASLLKDWVTARL